MPIFKYQGRDINGKLITGESSAISIDALSSQLLKENITPVKITLKKQKVAFWQAKAVNNNDLGLFTRQMYTLLKSGVPIMSAVRHLAEGSRNKHLSQVLSNVSQDLEAGQSLSTAMQHYPEVFTPLVIGMVHVGENTGHLDDVFLNITHYLETESDTVKRAKSAIRYPLFVMAAIIVGMIIINIFVIPIFSKVYVQAHIPLPKMTIYLLKLSNFFIDYWSVILIFIIVFFVGLARYLSTPKGNLAWSKFQLKLPIIGILLKRIILLRFAQTFAVIVNSGVPIVEGLSLVGQSISNAYARQEIRVMQESIQHGNSIIQAAYTCKLFSSIELQMLAVAEQTGELGAMLNEIAHYYQREVDYDLKKLTDMIEPLLLITISIMVLLLALAVYLPIWNMVKLVHH